MPTIHNIKIKQFYANDVLSGDKTFEVRINDRDYLSGDSVVFQVVDDKTEEPIEHPLNGKDYRITYLLRCFPGMRDGLCVFSIKPVKEEDATICSDSTYYCPVDDVYSYSGSGMQRRKPFVVDPNTQCVDCRYGTPVRTPDGLATSIRCDAYDGTMRTPQDTCLANVVDMRSFTANREGRDK